MDASRDSRRMTALARVIAPNQHWTDRVEVDAAIISPRHPLPQRAQNAIGHTRILSLITPPSLALQHRKGSVDTAPVRVVSYNPASTDRLPHSVIPLGHHRTYGIRPPFVALPEASPASQARAGPAAGTTIGYHQDQHIDSDRHRSNRDRAVRVTKYRPVIITISTLQRTVLTCTSTLQGTVLTC